MAIFIVILADYINGFDNHLMHVHPFFSAPSISKTMLENSPVLESFKKSLLMSAYSCNEFLVFTRVLISPHNYLAWFTGISTISNNSIPLFILKIKGTSIPTFFRNFLFASTKNWYVMCCWLKGSSEWYNPSLPDIQAGFIFLFDQEEFLVRNMTGKEKRITSGQEANTYQAAGVTFVVKPSTTWVLVKFMGAEVTAVNACYMPFPMSKHKLDFPLFQGLYHFSIFFHFFSQWCRWFLRSISTFQSGPTACRSDRASLVSQFSSFYLSPNGVVPFRVCSFWAANMAQQVPFA